MASAEIISTAQGAGENAVSGTSFHLPSVEDVLAGLAEVPSSLPTKGSGNLELSSQEAAFASFNDELSRGPNSLGAIPGILNQLWASDSSRLVQAAEALANKSREASWRAPIGQSGILKFFLELIASPQHAESDLLLHSLRLAGNSCADTNENRKIVVDEDYTLAILRHFTNPELIHVAIPVIYNICMDFEPAHAQMAANQTAYILSKLLADGLGQNESLLGFSSDLIELASEQAQAVEISPDGIIYLLIKSVSRPELEFEHFSPLANSLATYLEKERFQNVLILNDMVDEVLSTLEHSFSIEVDTTSKEDVQAIAQLRLKINQALAETSASALFAEKYPLDSPLCQKLKTWVVAAEDQLQICGCVMLGNLARSDEVCQTMVQGLKIHEELIAVLKNNSRGAVLHASLGFLKNLAIAGDNRISLVEAGIIPAISPLWDFDTVPQVQFAAASIARQLINASLENISHLLASAPDESGSTNEKTYLSLLLTLFEKTDSVPIKTEIGRTVASICRTATPKARESNEQAIALLAKLFDLHPSVGRPVGAMITQTQWPVVRSEGWFALALMANTPSGCAAAVVDVLNDEDVKKLLGDTLSGSSDENGEEAKDQSQVDKDRENVFVLVQEVLKNESDILLADYRATMEDLVKKHASQLQSAIA